MDPNTSPNDNNLPQQPNSQNNPTMPPPPSPPPSSVVNQQVANDSSDQNPSQSSTNYSNPTSNYNNFNGAPLVKKKSKLPLVIFLILTFLMFVVVAGGIVAYLTFFSASAVSKRISNQFMSAATTGNKEKLYELTKSTSEDDKTFLDSASAAVKGSYKLSESATKDQKWYYLYSINGEKAKYARTMLEKKDGQWLVSGFFHSNEELALIPKESSNTETTKKETLTNNGDKCLVASDFDPWYKASYGATATSKNLRLDNPSSPHYESIKFDADSIAINDATAYGISSMIKLAKSVEGKEYKIRLIGSVGTTDPADLEFANKRAAAVKDKLIAGGVSADNIVIDPPKNVLDSSIGTPNEVQKRISRSVVLLFDPTCSAGSSKANTTNAGR